MKFESGDGHGKGHCPHSDHRRPSSEAKLNVVRQLEPLEFHGFDEFSLGGTANAVMLIGSEICDAVGLVHVETKTVSTR